LAFCGRFGRGNFSGARDAPHLVPVGARARALGARRLAPAAPGLSAGVLGAAIFRARGMRHIWCPSAPARAQVVAGGGGAGGPVLPPRVPSAL
jgi:hypothetical protein